MSEELKPCPFCGGADIIDADYGQEYWCKCRLCGCETGKYGNRFSADEAWNSRAQAAPEAEPVAINQWQYGDAWIDASEADVANARRLGKITRVLYTAPQHDAELIELKSILPELDDALENLELHGRHSDQGYRKLKDWYRKVANATARIDAKFATLQARL